MLIIFLSIVLMDELDQLLTTKQEVVYNFFNWPNLPNSRLVVIAVSNTHDLPERVMSAKVKSRLGESFGIPIVGTCANTGVLVRHGEDSIPSI